MQRTKTELEGMTHDELVERVLEAQDMLREGLAVRDSLHGVLNMLLKAKATEVEHYASVEENTLEPTEQDLKKAYAAARHALSNPTGFLKK
ncbi:MAG: hypothetical protein ACRCYY_15835 [Trueperaceae bacterium]